MFRVALPTRPWYAPSVHSRDYKSQRGYWEEGYGYEISHTQAQVMRGAISELSGMFDEAMDYVVKRDDILRKFHVLPEPNNNWKILTFARNAWLSSNRKRHFIDRWDMGWDKSGTPKLLERNFGHLGLIPGTGPVQEDYIRWLARQPGFADVQSFGNLQRAFIDSFRCAAEESGFDRRKSLGVIGWPNRLIEDRRMARTGHLLTQWVEQAGYLAKHIPADGISYDKKGQLSATRKYNYARNPFLAMWEESQDRHSGLGSYRKTYTSTETTALITAPQIYPFGSHEFYTYCKALAAEDIKPVNQSILPDWTPIMGNKAMLAVLHQLFPNHSNLLPTYMGTNALRGEKRILKRMEGCQGEDSLVINANNKVVAAKNMKGEKKPKRLKGKSGYVTQAFTETTAGSFDYFRVFNVFTTTGGQAAAMSVREAPGVFVGGKGTDTKMRPVIVRPDEVVARLNRTEDVEPPRPPGIDRVLFMINHIVNRI